MGHARLSTRSYSIHRNHCESRSESHLPRELTANEPRHSALALERRSVLIPCLIALVLVHPPICSPRGKSFGERLLEGSSRSRSTRKVQMGRSPPTTRRQVPSTPRQPTTGSQLLAPTPGLQALLLGEDPSSHMQADNGMVPATRDEPRASRKVLTF